MEDLPAYTERCLCRSCGKYFKSTAAFDKHRTGKYWPVVTRRCMTTEEMEKIGMANSSGVWVTESYKEKSARLYENMT